MFDLTQGEARTILDAATEAKKRGYSTFTGTFFPHQLSVLKVEVSIPREKLLELYKTSC